MWGSDRAPPPHQRGGSAVRGRCCLERRRDSAEGTKRDRTDPTAQASQYRVLSRAGELETSPDQGNGSISSRPRGRKKARRSPLWSDVAGAGQRGSRVLVKF